MVGRVVEIATDGRHLSIHRGFLVVAEHGDEMGRVALDEDLRFGPDVTTLATVAADATTTASVVVSLRRLAS